MTADESPPPLLRTPCITAVANAVMRLTDQIRTETDYRAGIRYVLSPLHSLAPIIVRRV